MFIYVFISHALKGEAHMIEKKKFKAKIQKIREGLICEQQMVLRSEFWMGR